MTTSTVTTVSTLNNQIKSLLESTFLSVAVEGEVSRVTYHSSGHLYFTLKDNSSSISCVMFKGNNQKLKFTVEDGMKLIVYGSVSVYSPRGSYQINCTSAEPSGNGALAMAFEQLKKKLEKKGYFDEKNKKFLPKFPKTVAVVTSKTGAALQDMLRVAKKRWPLVKIILIDTLVQGDFSAKSIAEGIKKADKLKTDIIVIGRGGGSLEDLWAFNEEIVADAIYQAKTPIVSAVGHEIDFMISDFTSDLRAPTPSAAFEMILPDKDEMLIYLDNLKNSYDQIMARVINKKNSELNQIYQLYKQNSLSNKISIYQNRVKLQRERLNEIFSFLLDKKREKIISNREFLQQKCSQLINKKEQMLNFTVSSLKSLDPSKKSKSGFAQIIKNGKIANLEDIKRGENFTLLSPTTKMECKSIKKTAIYSNSL